MVPLPHAMDSAVDVAYPIAKCIDLSLNLVWRRQRLVEHFRGTMQKIRTPPVGLAHYLTVLQGDGGQFGKPLGIEFVGKTLDDRGNRILNRALPSSAQLLL